MALLWSILYKQNAASKKWNKSSLQGNSISSKTFYFSFLFYPSNLLTRLTTSPEISLFSLLFELQFQGSYAPPADLAYNSLRASKLGSES